MSIHIVVVTVGWQGEIGIVPSSSEIVPFLRRDAWRASSSVERGMSAGSRERRKEFVVGWRITVVGLVWLASSSTMCCGRRVVELDAATEG